MATKIAWTDESWNPVIGCSKISAGCQNCYAEKMACWLAAMGTDGYNNGILTARGKWTGKTAFVESALKKPLYWKKPRMIFVCSMGDLFHESVPFEWIDKVMGVMVKCDWHIFQLLTKRPQRMKEYITKSGAYGPMFSHIWLGVTAENQEMADKLIPILLDIPAAVRFVSCEPLLEDIDLQLDHVNSPDESHGLDWVIVGAESGASRRECRVEWIDSIVEQCNDANVPCYVKQIFIDGKKVVDPSGFPQEFPKKAR